MCFKFFPNLSKNAASSHQQWLHMLQPSRITAESTNGVQRCAQANACSWDHEEHLSHWSMSRWQLEVSYGSSIYTTEIGHRYQPGPLPSQRAGCETSPSTALRHGGKITPAPAFTLREKSLTRHRVSWLKPRRKDLISGCAVIKQVTVFHPSYTSPTVSTYNRSFLSYCLFLKFGDLQLDREDACRNHQTLKRRLALPEKL